MGIMAGSAFVVLHGLMFDLCCCELFLKIVVAFEAKFSVGFDQELLIVRDMGAVAGSAFIVLDGLVFDLPGCKLLLDVLMALKAELPIRL